jgi:hypothetical protein
MTESLTCFSCTSLITILTKWPQFSCVIGGVWILFGDILRIGWTVCVAGFCAYIIAEVALDRVRMLLRWSALKRVAAGG